MKGPPPLDNMMLLLMGHPETEAACIQRTPVWHLPVRRIKYISSREIPVGDRPQPSGGLPGCKEVPMTRREDDPFGPERRGFEEAKDDIESRFDEFFRNVETGRLPPLSRRSSRDFRGLSADFRVDILDHDDEVIVVAELPGAEEDAIRIRLLNAQTLRITAR